VILDTDALSAFVDGDADVGRLLRLQARAAIPVIVLGEFLYGIAESRHRSAYQSLCRGQSRTTTTPSEEQTEWPCPPRCARTEAHGASRPHRDRSAS